MTTSIPPLEVEMIKEVHASIRELEPIMAEFRRRPIGAESKVELVSRRDLQQMAALQNLFFEHHFTSHRPVLGKWIVRGKKLVVGLLNRFLKISLVRQEELNQLNWELALAVHQLERRVKALETSQALNEDGGKACD